MRCSMFLCLALVSGTTAYGQQQQASVRVNGGTVVGQFIPDGQGQQSLPMPDPAFQQPTYQGQRHDSHCNCEVCRRRILSREVQVESKTIKRETVVTVIEETHPTVRRALPVQQQMAPDPCVRPQNLCPPQDPCLRQGGGARPSVGLAQWDTDFRGYRPQQCPPGQQPIRNGFSGRQGGSLVAVNGGFSLFGFGPQVNANVGRQPPPYAQSGYGQPWYGGR